MKNKRHLKKKKKNFIIEQRRERANIDYELQAAKNKANAQINYNKKEDLKAQLGNDQDY